MSNTNLGNQNITFQKFERGKADDINSLLSDILPLGIYKIDEITFSGTTVTLPAFIAVVKYDDHKNLIVKSSATIVLEGITSDCYITCSYTWNDTIQNYLNFEFKSLEDITSNDIVFGRVYISDGNIYQISTSSSHLTYGTTVKRNDGYNLDIATTSNIGIIAAQEISENTTFEYSLMDTYEKKELLYVDNSSLVVKKTVDNLMPLSKTQYNISSTDEVTLTDEYFRNNYYITNNGIENDLLLNFSNAELAEVNSSVITVINYSNYNVIISFEADAELKNSRLLSTGTNYLNIPKKGISSTIFGVIFDVDIYYWYTSYIYIPYLFRINGNSPDYSVVDVYNDNEDTWYANVDFPVLIWKSVGTTLGSSKGHIMSGADKSSGYNVEYNYQYEDINKTWTAKAVMTYRGYNASGFNSALSIYFLGGEGYYHIESLQQYSEPTDSWSRGIDFDYYVANHSICYYYNNAYVIGGINLNTNLLTDDNTGYNLSADTWTTLTSIGYDVMGHTVTNIFFDIYITGGSSSNSPITSIGTNTKYNIITQAYTSDTAITGNRAYSTGFSYQGQIYCSGGSLTDGSADYQDLFAYVGSGSWVSKGNPNSKQYSSNGFTI